MCIRKCFACHCKRMRERACHNNVSVVSFRLKAHIKAKWTGYRHTKYMTTDKRSNKRATTKSITCNKFLRSIWVIITVHEMTYLCVLFDWIRFGVVRKGFRTVWSNLGSVRMRVVPMNGNTHDSATSKFTTYNVAQCSIRSISFFLIENIIFDQNKNYIITIETVHLASASSNKAWQIFEIQVLKWKKHARTQKEHSFTKKRRLMAKHFFFDNKKSEWPQATTKLALQAVDFDISVDDKRCDYRWNIITWVLPSGSAIENANKCTAYSTSCDIFCVCMSSNQQIITSTLYNRSFSLIALQRPKLENFK